MIYDLEIKLSWCNALPFLCSSRLRILLRILLRTWLRHVGRFGPRYEAFFNSILDFTCLLIFVRTNSFCTSIHRRTAINKWIVALMNNLNFKFSVWGLKIRKVVIIIFSIISKPMLFNNNGIM